MNTTQASYAASPIRTVLFDLDGTLLDTAPDLAFSLNTVLAEHKRRPLSYESIRPVVSHGGIALIQLGFGLDPQHPGFEPLRLRLLDIYRENLCRKTSLFPGMEKLLHSIEQRGLNWGVVTNKPSWLTEPLLQGLQLSGRTSCIVSGDTLDKRKPHPAPMLHACDQTGSHASECVYIGDAQRDIEAGKSAGMYTLVALFGYIGEEDDPTMWGADGLLEDPLSLLAWLDDPASG